MNRNFLLAVLAAGLCTQFASDAQAQSMPSPSDNDPNRINVSCYRGPLRNTVAWDRPNAVFVEDLIQLGYTYPEAHAIGERVCRDEYGVVNSEHKIATLMSILKESPPRR